MKRGTIREDGMVLLRTKKGQQIWGTQHQWEKAEAWRINYMNKRRSIYRNISPEKKWKIGDYNPEIGKYYIRNSGNYTPIWGTIEELNKYREQRKDIKTKYVQKLKKQKRLESLQGNKRRRGDIDPVLNLVFFKYNYLTGAEFWYTKEKFNSMIQKEKAYRKRRSNKDV